MSFKLSQYNCIKAGKSSVAICNTFSGSLAVLSGTEYNKLQHIHKYDNLDNDIKEWLQQGFIVEKEKDELSIVNYCRCRDTFLKNRPIYRILTTSACNARCFYCYEKGRPVQAMSMKTAADSAEFIIRNTGDAEKVTINWFGGEPLLNHKVITLIMKRLIATCGKDKVVSSMVTNASLFSKELITLAKEDWNLYDVQITLDGMTEIHEKRKAYVDKGSSFSKTLETIGFLLSAGFRISLRLNYDKDNFTDIVKLINYIHETFGNPENLICYTYPLFSTISNKENSYVYLEDIPNYLPRLLDVLMDCGYFNPTKILQRRTNACFATDPYSYVINTDGLLYKCTMGKMVSSQSVGNVTDGIVMNNSIIEWTTPNLPKQCNECKLLPICQGGCRASRMLNMDESGCEIKKQLIEYTLNHLLNSISYEGN